MKRHEFSGWSFAVLLWTLIGLAAFLAPAILYGPFSDLVAVAFAFGIGIPWFCVLGWMAAKAKWI